MKRQNTGCVCVCVCVSLQQLYLTPEALENVQVTMGTKIKSKLRPIHSHSIKDIKGKAGSKGKQWSCGARCSSMVIVFAHGAMGRQIDPSWWTH